MPNESVKSKMIKQLEQWKKQQQSGNQKTCKGGDKDTANIDLFYHKLEKQLSSLGRYGGHR